MYLVFYVRFICKGCVREKECEDSRQWKTKAVFVSSSRVSIPQSDACALHMTGMRRVRTGWRQLVFASISRVRPSRETPNDWRLVNCPSPRGIWVKLQRPSMLRCLRLTNLVKFLGNSISPLQQERFNVSKFCNL